MPFAALAASLLLSGPPSSGAYASRRLLLDPSGAARPLAEGLYSGPAGAVRITFADDGWYRLESQAPDGRLGPERRVLFVPLGAAEEGMFALVGALDGGYAYALARIGPDGVADAVPDCDDPLDRTIAVDQGARPPDDDDMDRPCAFASPTALRAALDAYGGVAAFSAPLARTPPARDRPSPAEGAAP